MSRPLPGDIEWLARKSDIRKPAKPYASRSSLFCIPSCSQANTPFSRLNDDIIDTAPPRAAASNGGP